MGGVLGGDQSSSSNTGRPTVGDPTGRSIYGPTGKIEVVMAFSSFEKRIDWVDDGDQLDIILHCDMVTLSQFVKQ